MRSHRSIAGPRRGATLVIVAVMIIMLGGMAAFAMDLARVYSGTNELQTGSDAAALAGALRLQRRPGLSPVANVVSFAASNSAFGTPISIASSDVAGGFWDPTSSTFTPAAWTGANSVRVRSARTATLGFGRLLGVPTLSPARRGTAWLANQASLDCIKPWGFDLTYINGLLGNDITTQAGVEALRTATGTLAGQRSMTIVAGPDITMWDGSPIPPTVFRALTGSSSSRKNYENAIMDVQCDGLADYTVGVPDDREARQPGNGRGDVPRTTLAVELDVAGRLPAGARATCAVQVGVDATCYDPVTGAAGVVVSVAAITPVGTNRVNMEALLQFRLMCVYRGRGRSPPGRASTAGETCPWLAAAGGTHLNLMQGTLVGYPMVSVARTGPGNTLGNTIGPSQKLVLVQ
jgi:Flp pilus assembly protein TadG